jgi:hypothetical protein
MTVTRRSACRTGLSRRCRCGAYKLPVTRKCWHIKRHTGRHERVAGETALSYDGFIGGRRRPAPVRLGVVTCATRVIQQRSISGNASPADPRVSQGAAVRSQVGFGSLSVKCEICGGNTTADGRPRARISQIHAGRCRVQSLPPPRRLTLEVSCCG